jgi:hypothetical protein
LIIISLIVSLCIQGVALVATFCKSIWNRLMVVPLVLALGTTASAAVKDSVVMVGDCSGVCVDPSGLILTAKHCEHPPVVIVKFKDRTVTARQVYVSAETEGPVMFDCDGDDFPFAKMAEAPPCVGDTVWSYGYPTAEGQRELRWIRGPLLGCRKFEFQGGSFRGNVTGFPTKPGWSGGPLFTRNSEVCGLLNSSDAQTSVFISCGATLEALNTCRERVNNKRSLYVFGSKACGPCQKFKQHYAEKTVLRQRLDAVYAVTYVDIDLHPAAAEQFGIQQVPAFVVPGQPAVTGYESPDELLQRLGLEEAEKPEVPAIVPPPPVEKPKAPQPAEPATDKPASTPKPDRTLGDKIDAAAGVAQTAITVATWLGITGATGGTGGLILGGIALWRTLRRRKESVTARDPPAPTVITVDSPPPPQAIVPETRFAPYERDTFAEAFAWAEAELVRKYPGSVSMLEAMKGLIDQFLSGKGLKR